MARAERLTSCQQRMNLLIKEEAATTSYDTRLVIEGEIDAYTAPQLREKLLPLCKEHQKISIDLSGVNYMDSTGLGVLIGAYKLLKAGSENWFLLVQINVCVGYLTSQVYRRSSRSRIKCRGTKNDERAAEGLD